MIYVHSVRADDLITLRLKEQHDEDDGILDCWQDVSTSVSHNDGGFGGSFLCSGVAHETKSNTSTVTADDAEDKAADALTVDNNMLYQLLEMGFEQRSAIGALEKSENNMEECIRLLTS